jgi:predicted nucleic acid-binding protein
MILVDSSVLIDVIEAQNDEWADWSEAQLQRAMKQGGMAINLVVYAEIARDFDSAEHLDEFLSDLQIQIDPLNPAIAYQAAFAHGRYRATGGLRSATLPDFFIGAHAQVKGYALLTRDPTRIRNYFQDVSLICPS